MDKKIKILLLIDCQVDFISGSLANEEAQKAIPNIVEKIKNFDGDAIYLTMDTHDDNYLDTPEGKKLPVKHCIYGTDGWKINKDIQRAIDAKDKKIVVAYIEKPTFGAVETVKHEGDIIPDVSLVEAVLILENGFKKPIPMEIEMCGFISDICVLHNAIILKAYTYDFAEITVDSKCCAGSTPENHQKAMDLMKIGQINVI